MRILIVEDEFKIADVIASRLRKENYIVDVYSDRGQALITERMTILQNHSILTN